MILFKPITNRKGETYVVKVDYVDAHLFLQYNYYIKRGKSGTGKPYCARGMNVIKPCGSLLRRTVFLHNDINNHVPNGTKELVTDHINRDTLDNRRKNLRLVTQKINLINQGQRSLTDGYIFARKRAKGTYYQIYWRKNYIGSFKDYDKAVRVRDEYLKNQGKEGEAALEEIYKDKIRQ
jgi:hypothetical protein